jgi:hypothetical protein
MSYLSHFAAMLHIDLDEMVDLPQQKVKNKVYSPNKNNVSVF